LIVSARDYEAAVDNTFGVDFGKPPRYLTQVLQILSENSVQLVKTRRDNCTDAEMEIFLQEVKINYQFLFQEEYTGKIFKQQKYYKWADIAIKMSEVNPSVLRKPMDVRKKWTNLKQYIRDYEASIKKHGGREVGKRHRYHSQILQILDENGFHHSGISNDAGCSTPSLPVSPQVLPDVIYAPPFSNSTDQICNIKCEN